MDLSSERKEDPDWEINLQPKIACEAIIKGNTHTHQLEGKIEKARRVRIVTNSPLQQLLTRTRRKMSLKLPRNWDFNLKGEAGKIGMVHVFWLPLWLFYLSTHHLHVGLQGA